MGTFLALEGMLLAAGIAALPKASSFAFAMPLPIVIAGLAMVLGDQRSPGWGKGAVIARTLFFLYATLSRDAAAGAAVSLASGAAALMILIDEMPSPRRIRAIGAGLAVWVVLGALGVARVVVVARSAPADQPSSSSGEFATTVNTAGCTMNLPPGHWKMSSMRDTNLAIGFERGPERAVALLYGSLVPAGSRVDLDSLMVQVQRGLSPQIKDLQFLHEPTPAPGSRDAESRYVRAYWLVCAGPAPLGDALSSELHQIVSSFQISSACRPYAAPKPVFGFASPAR